MKRKALMMTNAKADFGLIIPAGTSLMAVLGFNLSIFLSRNRLKAIAALRAKTIHRITNIKLNHEKSTVDWLTAKKNPSKAKGSAKMV